MKSIELNNINLDIAKPRRIKNKITPEEADGFENLKLINDEDIEEEHVSASSKKENIGMKMLKAPIINFAHLLGGYAPTHMLYLFLVGLLSALNGSFVEMTLTIIYENKLSITENKETDWYLRYMIWIIYAIIFGWIAAAAGEYICREVEGSGFPELKAILDGLSMDRFFSIHAYIGKFVGIIGMITCGFSVGRTGTLVHHTVIIAYQLTRFKWFDDINKNLQLQKQMISAAVACGVTCTFGAPLGGVILSIELTSSLYMVNNLWRAFLCSTCAYFVFKFCHMFHIITPFPPTHFEPLEFDHEIFFYIGLGIISGFIAGLQNIILSKLVFLRTKLKAPFFANRWYWTIGVAVFIGLITFPIEFLHLTDKQMTDMMFNPNDLLSFAHGQIWKKPAELFNLIIYVILKFIFIVLSLSIPGPNGIFGPFFAYGSGLGRCYAVLIRSIGELFGVKLIKHENLYALVGSAAYFGACTKTLAPAVMFLEISGQTSNMMALLLGVLASNIISNSMAMSIFDWILEFKQLPFMPTLGSVDSYHKTAKEIMNKNFMYITKDAKLSDISMILSKIGRSKLTLPVVESEAHKFQEFIEQEGKQLLETYFQNIQLLSKDDYQKKNLTADPLADKHCESLEKFWNTSIDFDDKILQIDLSPFIVMEDAPISKIHFLFMMLGITYVNVLNGGIIKGIITKQEFLKKRRQDLEQKDKGESQKNKIMSPMKMGPLINLENLMKFQSKKE